LSASPAELAKLLISEPENIERVLAREDAQSASLQDRVRSALDSFPEGPPPHILIFAAVAARIAGDGEQEQRHLDALRKFLGSPGGQEWQEKAKEGIQVPQSEPFKTGEYPGGLTTYMTYVHIIAEAHQRAIAAALAAEEDVDGLPAAEFLSLLRQYASRPSALDPQAMAEVTAKVRARLAAPMSDFLFDQAVNVAIGAFGNSVVNSLVERFTHTPDEASR
jgi:hypothetical protein